MNKHTNCADTCQLWEHKGKIDCSTAGVCFAQAAVEADEVVNTKEYSDY